MINNLENQSYRNVSDLGLAAFENRVEDVDGLVAGGCEVNYNGSGFTALNIFFQCQSFSHFLAQR